MRKTMRALIVLTLLIVVAGPVMAGRLEDMQARYAKLSAQKRQIETEMIRLEGQFIERQAIMAEEKVEALVEEQAAKEAAETKEEKE